MKFVNQVLTALLLAASCSAHASIVTYTNEATWKSAVVTTHTQNFNSYVTDTTIGTAGISLGGGMTLSSSNALNWRVDAGVPVSHCNVNGTSSVCGHNSGVLTFTFAGGISAFSATFSQMNDNQMRTHFELFSGNTLIATLAPPMYTGSAVDDWFYGFRANAGESITSMRTKVVSGDGFGFDNVAISATAVPEPSSLAILGLGLLGLARSRRMFPKR